MYCPNCRAEFRDDAGLTACTECGGPLSAGELPEEAEPVHDEEIDLAVVFTTGDVELLSVARNLLDQAGIPSYTEGEGAQDLFGVGRLGVGAPATLKVRREDETAALDLLADVGAGGPPELVTTEGDEETG